LFGERGSAGTRAKQVSPQKRRRRAADLFRALPELKARRGFSAALFVQAVYRASALNVER